MVDRELLTAIGGLLDEKLEPVNARLGALEEKVDGLDARVGTLGEKVDKLDVRVGALEEGQRALGEKVDKLDVRVGALEEGVKALDVKIDQKIDELAEQMSRDTATVVLELSSTIGEANDAMLDRIKTLEDATAQNSLDVQVMRRRA